MKSKSALIFSAVFLFLAAQAFAAPALSVSITLRARPTTHDGPCPTPINFKATFTVNQACKLNYRIVRSDGWKGQILTAGFGGPQTSDFDAPVSWKESFTGWVAIEASPASGLSLRGGLGGATFLSNHVDLKIACAAAPAPVITSIKVHCDGAPCDEFDIYGTNFGATQGSRKVRIDAIEPSMVHLWSDTKIIVEGGVCTVWDKTYHFGIYDGVTLLSSIFPQQFGASIDSFSPASGNPGTTVTLHALGAGATAAGKTVKMGTANMPIVSWTGSACASTVVVTVPSIAPGPYVIDIFSGGTKIASCSFYTVK
jgi:hypothetical protein